MAKNSRLSERPTRMPDITQAQKELAISEYLRVVAGLNTESAISHRFTLLLNSLFGVQPGFIEEYVKGIEVYLKARGKDRILCGRADELSGNVIIEFETALDQKARLLEAHSQLRRYCACVWSDEHPSQRRKYICLATDGIIFRAYAPTLRNPSRQTVEREDVELAEVEHLDASQCSWEDFYFFLDRYLLRREVLPPKTERIIRDFGPRSHAFHAVREELLACWKSLRSKSEFSILFQTWDKYLRIVYGGAQADEELFIRHTYLAVLARLMVWRRFAEQKTPPSTDEILSVLEGSYFKFRLSIENFLEEDFFCWVTRPGAQQTAIRLARLLIAHLLSYNLRELSEDVLKGLYEGLVDPQTRHDLGEYYTPDWLADRIIKNLLQSSPSATLLDPACGSGTFLYMAIREKRRLLGDSAKALKHITSSVVGIDIHPLACIIAKANYVLALGRLMGRRRTKINIPVYMANSIRPPAPLERSLEEPIPCHETEIYDRKVRIPDSFMEDGSKYELAIESAREFAVHNRGRQIRKESFINFIKNRYPELADDDQAISVLYSVAQTLKEMVEEGRDTIWAFVLKNIYKPLLIRKSFDFVVGNPPWLSYRYVERSDYKRFLKKQITDGYALVRGQAQLVTHLELGTLFLLRCADLYLAEGGRIAFVLPKSIFSADHHDRLRRGKTLSVQLTATELWDLEGVSPLFNISACVYFGEEVFDPLRNREVKGEILEGSLTSRNADLCTAKEQLKIQPAIFKLSRMGKRSFWTSGKALSSEASSYRESFRQGASIVPRAFWFVDLRATRLVFDQSLPPVRSSERAIREAKKAYQGCVIEGTVERQFIYATLLLADMLPFGFLRLRMVVLPIISAGDQYRLLDADTARSEGYIHLAEWLDKVEAEWSSRRSPTSEKLSAIEWLNYRRKLTIQKPTAGFRAIYATSGTNLCACVFSGRYLGEDAGFTIKPLGFIADTKTYHYESSQEAESRYLVAILNSRRVNEAIKPSQSSGLWGPRDVHKKVLELPIPRFDPSDEDHLRLAEIARHCERQVREWVKSGGPGRITSIGVLRGRVRQLLKEELEEIDSIVKPILNI